MYSEILHIYGPFSIHSFGVMIAIGLLAFIGCANNHPLRKQYMSSDAFMDLVMSGACVAVFGGRFLYLLTHLNSFDQWYEAFFIWQGGFSLLGSVIACILFVPIYLWYKNIPLLPCLDLIGIHAPLLQGISRIGCLLAGCCYGKATQLYWPTVHPTQLYSAALLIIIFFILRLIYASRSLHAGQFFALYLIMISLERFTVDFFRADQEFFTNSANFLSIHQWLSIVFFSIGLLGLVLTRHTLTYSRAS